jgi:hypothetical protein
MDRVVAVGGGRTSPVKVPVTAFVGAERCRKLAVTFLESW